MSHWLLGPVENHASCRLFGCDILGDADVASALYGAR